MFFKVVNLNGRAPTYLSQNFTTVSDIHSYNTRDCNLNFILPSAVGMMANSFVYNATKDWNGLPADLKSLKAEKIFKSKLKDFLIGRALHSESV